LEGKDVPHKTILQQVYVTNANVKLCEGGSWEEMKAGCNVFPPSIVTNPGWFAQLYNKDIPELGLSAALFGRPEY
jgi:ribose transport system substrate-binding protein